MSFFPQLRQGMGTVSPSRTIIAKGVSFEAAGPADRGRASVDETNLLRRDEQPTRTFFRVRVPGFSGRRLLPGPRRSGEEPFPARREVHEPFGAGVADQLGCPAGP